MASSTTTYIPLQEAESHTPLPETELQINEVFVDIPKEIRPELYEPFCCIYKVPHHVRKLENGEAYTPLLISIGPIHHTRRILKPMQAQKQRYCVAFWERIKRKKDLVKYKTSLKDNIKMIQTFYSEIDINIEDNQFVDMIMLDSVFIIELFMRKSENIEDYLFSKSLISKSIQRDLLLLENQLPFFLLEQLHRRVFKDDNGPSFLELAFKYFENFNPQRSDKPQNEEMLKNCKSCKHFTDLIRYFYLPEEVFYQGWSPSAHFLNIDIEDKWVLKTATKLNDCGVNLEKLTDHKRLLNITLYEVPLSNWFLCMACFNSVKTKLEIPQLKVHQNTECVLRNLIALELCHYSDQPFICNYVSLINSLINTQEDADFLVDKEIIVHELGSHEELATMINGLCKNVVVTCNYYGKTSKKLNVYYNTNRNWKYYMSVLQSVYFRDPWRLSSTVVGVVIFLFAIISFLSSVGLYNPKH